jgi:hypothetical protein
MATYITAAKDTCKSLIASITKDSMVKDVKFAFVAYRDHPPEDKTFVTKVEPLCNQDAILAFIAGMNADGGGDGPEAVLDGLNDSVRSDLIGWRTYSQKFIFHIADAPPHGKLYTDSHDNFSGGCPCGLKIENIAKEIEKQNIQYKLLKVGTNLDRMPSIFRTHIKGYDEGTLKDATEVMKTVTDTVKTATKILETKLTETKAAEKYTLAKYA